MRRTSLEVLLCGLSLFDVLVLLSTLLIYPAMNACQNQPNPVREAYRTHKQLTQSNTRTRRDVDERKMTVMTIVMTGIFVLCNIPPAINNIIDSHTHTIPRTYRTVTRLSTLLVCDSASNILIYCWFNRQFRRTVFRICSSSTYKRANSQYIPASKTHRPSDSSTSRAHKLSII
ncbi:hypothetical protein OSTOST_06370 [Ostertagia ostertagi]